MKRVFAYSALVLTTAGQAQSVIKPLEIPDGKAKEQNAEAIQLFRKGHFEDALKAIDQASLRDLENPAPWVNGALLNFELGRLGRASNASRQAYFMGDRSSRRSTINIQINSAKGKLSQAWDAVELSEFLEPNDPYLHRARADYAKVSGERGIEERSLWQAALSGPTPILDFKENTASSFSAGAGAPGRAEASWQGRLKTDSLSATAEVTGLASTLGGVTPALQRSGRAAASVYTPYGLVMASHRMLESERPGAVAPLLSLPSTPGSKLRHSYSTIGWQKSFGKVTVNLNYRESDSDLKTSSSSPYLRNNFLQQWMAEGRYDSGPWTLGGGISEVYRNGVANPAVHPMEDLFGLGRTRLAHAYAVHRRDIGSNLRLVGGAVVTRVDNQTHVLATAELAIRLAGSQFLRIGMEPTMSRSGTVLFPEDLRGRRLAPNPIDSMFSGSPMGGGSTSLFSPTGKISNLFASIPLSSAKTLTSSVTLFQKQFSQANFLSGNPNLQSGLQMTRVNKGKVTGAELSTTWTPTTQFSATLKALVQNSSASYDLPTSETQAPNIPRQAFSLDLDGSLGSASVFATLTYLGPKVQAIGEGQKINILNNSPKWGLDLGFSQPLGPGRFQVTAGNLLRSSFFDGFSSSPTLLVNYQMRF